MRYAECNRCTKKNNQIIELSFIKCMIVLLQVRRKHTAKYQLCYFLLKFWAFIVSGNFERFEFTRMHVERSQPINVHMICIGTVSRATIIIRVIVVCSRVGGIQAAWSNRP